MTTTLDRPNPYDLKPSPTRKRGATAASARAASARATSARAASARAGSARAADPRRDVLREGLRAMTHEQPERARDLLAGLAADEALEAGDSIAIDALAYLSSVVWTLKDPVAAIDMVERALELGSGRFAPNQKGGEIAWRLGLLEKAETRFLAALRASDPGSDDAKAAERCLREVRKQAARSIRHGTRGIGIGRLARFVRLRKPTTETARTTAQRTA